MEFSTAEELVSFYEDNRDRYQLGFSSKEFILSERVGGLIVSRVKDERAFDLMWEGLNRVANNRMGANA